MKGEPWEPREQLKVVDRSESVQPLLLFASHLYEQLPGCTEIPMPYHEAREAVDTRQAVASVGPSNPTPKCEVRRGSRPPGAISYSFLEAEVAVGRGARLVLEGR